MQLRRFAQTWVLPVGLMILCVGVLGAQEYPNKPIRLATTSAGGSADLITRFTAQGLSPGLGQPVIVDNRGGGVIPGEAVAKAPPDGYLLLVHSSTVWASQYFQKVPFDAVRDLVPISWLVRSPLLLAVHPSLPVTSVKELIALTKARPGELNYSSGPNGTTGHIAAELFRSMAGVNIVRVIYGGSNTTEIADLLSGQMQLTFSASVWPHVKSGRLKALAVTGAQPSTLFPGLPAVAAFVPGFELLTIIGMWAPAKTPDAIIRRLNQEAVRYFNLPDTRQRLLGMGFEAVGSSPEEFAAVIKSDMAALDRLAKNGVFK